MGLFHDCLGTFFKTCVMLELVISPTKFPLSCHTLQIKQDSEDKREKSGLVADNDDK